MIVSDRMKEFVDRLEASGVASPSDLAGCSLEEIARLECKYSVRLPDSYSLFLNVMGHRAGTLVSAAEFDIYYPTVLELTERRRQICCEIRKEEPDAVVVELPAQSLIICSRYGEQLYLFSVASNWRS